MEYTNQKMEEVKNSHGARKILIFSLTYFPYIGGAEVAVKELTDRMKEYEFHMITLCVDRHLPRTEKMGRVILHRIGFAGEVKEHSHIEFPLSINKYIFPFFSFFEALSLHRIHRFDAVWSIMANYAGFGALFFKLTHPEVSFFLNIQEGDSIEHIKKRVGIFYPLFAHIFKKADYIHTISSFLKNFARSMGGRKVEVVPNGIDVGRFMKGYATIEIEELKRKHSIPPHASVVVTTSRLVPKNGIEDLILSLVFLPDSVHLLIVGDGPEKKRLLKRVQEKGLSSRVHFVGQVPYEEVPKYLEAAEVFARPSHSEGLGNSFLEAMAAEVPIVGTSVGGITDFLFDPVSSKNPTGLFATVGNPESIAAAISRLLSDLALRQTLISNAHRLVCDNYDWEKIAQNLSNSFLTVIKHEKTA